MTEDEALNAGNLMTDFFIKGFREGKLTERKRIVKLLKDFIDQSQDFDGMAFYRMGVLDSIATIEKNQRSK
jgi:hypothetical protein